MKALKTIINEHKIALLLAALTSFLVVFPQVYFRIEHRDDGIYKGIELLPDSPWSARVREIQDGHGFGSIYYKDGKNNPYLFQPLGSMTVAYMGKLFSLEINNTILLSRIILPFFAYILIYLFVIFFSKDKITALCSASVILLADSVLNFSGFPRILFDGMSPSSFLELSRPVNSAMIFIPFFAFLASFWIFFQKKDRRWGFVSSFVLGLNFYTYFYTWTYLYAFGAILGAIYLFRKKWLEIKQILAVFLGALIVALPYFINMYRATLHPNYEVVGARFGVVTGHGLVFVGLTVTIALIVFLLRFPRGDKERYFFIFSLILAPFITLNQQIITGKVLQEGHYHWYFHKPLAVIVVLFVFFYWLTEKGLTRVKRLAAVSIIALSFSVGTYVQGVSYFNDYQGRDGGYIAVERQKFGPVVDWLNENAEKEDVVFANNEISHLTVIYTSLNVFHHRASPLSLSAAENRVRDEISTFYRLKGVTKDNVAQVFFEDRSTISTQLYGVFYRDMSKSYADIPEDKLNEMVDYYVDTLSVESAKWLYNIWNKYEVEYLVWDKVKDPEWKLDRFNYLEKAAEFGTVSIYRFKQ